jgi:hypothetical protein
VRRCLAEEWVVDSPGRARDQRRDRRTRRTVEMNEGADLLEPGPGRTGGVGLPWSGQPHDGTDGRRARDRACECGDRAIARLNPFPVRRWVAATTFCGPHRRCPGKSFSEEELFPARTRRASAPAADFPDKPSTMPRISPTPGYSPRQANPARPWGTIDCPNTDNRMANECDWHAPCLPSGQVLPY